MMSSSSNKLVRSNSKESKRSSITNNLQSFKSNKLICSYVINYVATIKGSYNDIDKANKLVSEKKTKSYEKMSHPVYLQLINKKRNKNAEIILCRTNSNKKHVVNISTIKADSKNLQYCYLVEIDNLDASRSRTHIFNVLNETVLQQIKNDIPHFGTIQDMTNHNYTIPTDMLDVVRSIQIYCLPKLGYHVAEIKEKMSISFKNIFAKKCKEMVNSNNSVKIRLFNSDNREVKCKISELNRPTSPELMEKMNSKPSTSNLDCKSRSIENLLLSNVEFGSLIPFSNPNSRFTSPREWKKSSSTQSSLNGDEMEHQKSDENVYYYKFENVLRDEIGLKHFKNFLEEEFSSENIKFWEAVKNYSKITDEKLMKSEAKKIFYNYMDEQTNTPVNLECDVVETVRKQLNEPTIDMFTVARNHIFHLMKNDSYSRFIISKHFNLWQNSESVNSEMKSASSTSSLNHPKKRRFLLPNFLKNKNRISRDESRKSSIQTIDSDCGSSGMLSTGCKITFAYDVVNVHILASLPNKKLSYVLKKMDKKFFENDLIAFDESDQRIVHFNENMQTMYSKRIVVERASLFRIGYVQNSLDTMLYENLWFVIKCRSSICLSSAIDPIVRQLQLNIVRCCVVQEDNPMIKLEWDTPMQKLHNSILLLLEEEIFQKAKLFGRPLMDLQDTLWKKIMKDYYFQSSLPFDSDNLLNSTSEFFLKYKLEPRRVGYLLSNAKEDNFEITLNRIISTNFDDQRGLCTEEQLSMPEFLKEYKRSTSDDSSSLNSKHYSAITFGDSEFSFSEIDESSDPSPEKYELISDLE